MLLAAASLATLAACGGSGDDAAGEAVQEQAEQKADAMEQQAETMEGAGNEAAADQMEDQAEATREQGGEMEEAIDDADGNHNQDATGTGTTTTGQ